MPSTTITLRDYSGESRSYHILTGGGELRGLLYFLWNQALARLPPARGAAPATVYVVPVMPLPKSVSGPAEASLMGELSRVVAISVAQAESGAAGSGEGTPPPGAVHLLLISRVCSCAVVRAPRTGRQSRDACMPFRDHPTLSRSRAVVHAAYEQVSPHDRAKYAAHVQWSRAKSANGTAPAGSAPPAARPPNFVVPYPSSVRGVPHAGRTPRKAIRVAAVFGMLSHMMHFDSVDAKAVCGEETLADMAISSCAGKECRFALRALVLSQMGAVWKARNHKTRWVGECLHRGVCGTPIRALPVVFKNAHDTHHARRDNVSLATTQTRRHAFGSAVYLDQQARRSRFV